jgi:serine/threonine-protein kinase NIM1
VAIKVVDRSKLDCRALRMLSREIEILETLQNGHPNILKLFEVIETLGKVNLITEYVRGGELYDRISERGPLSEPEAIKIFKQVCLAIQFIHKSGYCHRDIKAENILMVSDTRIKLADFGFSTVATKYQPLTTFCGSPPYAAPELFTDDHYVGTAVDIWALGILLFFCVIGNMPFQLSSVPQLRMAILNGSFTISSVLSLPCCRLIQRILVHVPARRPTIEQILGSQWLSPACYKFLSSKAQKVVNNSSPSHQPPRRRVSIWFKNGQTRRKVNARRTTPTHTVSLVCTTKRSFSVLDDKFLFPLTEQQLFVAPEVAETAATPVDKRFSLKKKICPIDNELEKGMFLNRIATIDISASNVDSKKATSSSYMNISTISMNSSASEAENDVQNQRFVSFPSQKSQLDLHPLELETRRILKGYGITEKMLFDACLLGPRSELIGIYRIVLNRLQRQDAHTRYTERLVIGEMLNHSKKTVPHSTKPKNRNCAIL